MSVTVTHTVDRLADALRRAPKKFRKDIDRAVGAIAGVAAKMGKEDAPKFLSEIANSIGPDKIADGHHIAQATAAHARYVHEGTGPGGTPPIEALRRWVSLNQMRPREGRSERDMLFLIARKIRREGTPAQPFFKRALETSPDRMLALLDKAGPDSINESLS